MNFQEIVDRLAKLIRTEQDDDDSLLEKEAICRSRLEGFLTILRRTKEGVSLDSDTFIGLIHELHNVASCGSVSLQHDRSPPERERMLTENCPGSFRSGRVGIPSSEENRITIEGIAELLAIIDSQKGKFLEYHGFFLCPPIIRDGHVELDLNNAVTQTTIHTIFGKSSLYRLAEALHPKIENYHLVSPSTDNTTGQEDAWPSPEEIHKFLPRTLKTHFNTFNNAMREAEGVGDTLKKYELIVQFIQTCLRIHPFRDCNHRVFAKDLLNFLLIKHLGVICPLENLRQFTFTDLQNAVRLVQSNSLQITEENIAGLIEFITLKIPTIGGHLSEIPPSSVFAEPTSLRDRDSNPEMAAGPSRPPLPIPPVSTSGSGSDAKSKQSKHCCML